MGRESAEADAASAEGPAGDEPLDQSEVNRIIREKLTSLKHGDLFMEGLGQECYGKLIGGDRMTKNLSKFLSIVAAALVEAEGTDGSTAKKRKKKYLKVLKISRESVEQQIRIFEGEVGGGAPAAAPEEEETQPEEKDGASQEQPKPDGISGSKAEKLKPEKLEVDEEEEDLRSNDGVDDDGLDEDTTHDGSSSHSHKRLKKKSKKRRRKHHKEKKKSKKEKKRRSKNELDSDSDGEEVSDAAAAEEMNGARRKGRERAQSAEYLEAKEKFEEEKQKTLDKIPRDVKSRFRRLCFSSWSKSWLPAVELGPYDVAPGPVRDQWFKMFYNVKKNKRPLTRLVYWYGTPRDNPADAYSFQPAKLVIPYELGLERSLDKLPPKVQKKVENKKPLSKTEQQHQRALVEIQDEVGLEPEDRLEWTKGWDEEYELLAASTPPDDDAGEDDQLEDDELMESADESSRKSKRKKKRKKGGSHETGKSSKKGKKRRKSKEPDDEEMEDEGSGSKRSKKSKKRRKKTKEDPSIEAEKEPELEAKEEPKLEVKEVPKVEAKEDVMDVDDEEIPTDEAEDDDFQEDEESGLESDENLDAVLSSSKKGKKGKAKAVLQKKRKAEMTEEEKEKAHQEHLAKRRERDRQRRLEKKKEKVSSPLELEQIRFEECEQRILPLMSRLEKATASTDADLAEECLNELHTNIEIITPPFIQEHGIGMAIKRTRKALEASGNIKSLCHSLTKELKRVYKEKLKLVPEGFEPKKSKPKPSSVDVAKSATRKDAEKVKAEEESSAKVERPRSPKRSKEEPQSPEWAKEQPSSPRRLKEEKDSSDQSIPKKTPKSSAPEQSAPTEVPKAAPSKPARKSGFSLKGMIFEKPKPTPKAAGRAPPSERAASAAKAARAVAKKEIPEWLKTRTPDTKTAAESEVYRCLALEFLLDAARQLPKDEVNVEAVARALEAAIFDLSQLKHEVYAVTNKETAADRAKEAYWEKVHDISASITGKQGQGSLYRDMLDGVHSSPKDVVKLDWKGLKPSLEDLAA